MPAPATTIAIKWTGVRTDRNDRDVQVTELTSLVNYRRLLDGQFDKRLGMVRQGVTVFHGASYLGPATAFEACTTALWRDSADQFWVLDDGTGEGYFRGRHQRAHPSWFEVRNLANFGGARKPAGCMRGDDLFTFSLGCRDIVGAVDQYQITVVNPLTGLVKRETETVAANGIKSYAVATDELDNIWLVYVTGGDTITCHKYSAADGSPVITTYATQAGAKFIGIDIRAVPGQAYMVVAALSSSDDGTDRLCGIFRSYASTAGGVATGSDFDVTNTSGDWTIDNTSGISILEGEMAADTWHVAYVRGGTASGSAKVVLDDVALLSPGTVTTTELATHAVAVGIEASVSGWRAANGDRVVLATIADATSELHLLQKCSLRVEQYTFDGATTTPRTAALSAWVASKPFQRGDDWFYLTGFDDDDDRGPASMLRNVQVGAQNGFFVRDADGTILTTVLDGEGGFAFFGTTDSSGIHNCRGEDSHIVAPSVLPTGEVVIPLLNIGLVRNRPGRTVAVIDFAATYYSEAPGIVPGGINVIVGPSDSVAEISPIHSPYQVYEITTFPGAFDWAVFITYRYKITDSAGKVYRSAPYRKGLTADTYTGVGSLAQLKLPTLRHVIGAKVEIEVYGSANGELTMELRDSVLNDATVDSVTLDIYPLLWQDGTSEILDTTNGVPNFSPEPARLAWVQGSRLMLGGTPSGDVWASVEQFTGHGPEFPEVTNFGTNQFGSGGLTAGIELASDSSAVFKRDGIAIVTGTPDGRGAGGWAVTVLKVKKGVGAPTEVCTHPLGVVFRNYADGRMQLLAAGSVVAIAQGQEAYRSLRFTAALECPGEGMVKFFCATGALCLDYAHPPADGSQPAGTWVWHEGEAFPGAVGARMLDAIPVTLDAGEVDSANLWRPSDGITDADFLDDGGEVLTDAITGRMPLAGFLAEFDTDWTFFSSTHMGGDSTFEYTLTGTDGPEVHADAANDTADVAFRTDIQRTREVRLRVRETSATGQGRRFDGAAIQIRSYGRERLPNRLIA